MHLGSNGYPSGKRGHGKSLWRCSWENPLLYIYKLYIYIIYIILYILYYIYIILYINIYILYILYILYYIYIIIYILVKYIYINDYPMAGIDVHCCKLQCLGSTLDFKVTLDLSTLVQSCLKTNNSPQRNLPQ
jgi:hypothetical protein